MKTQPSLYEFMQVTMPKEMTLCQWHKELCDQIEAEVVVPQRIAANTSRRGKKLFTEELVAEAKRRGIKIVTIGPNQ